MQCQYSSRTSMLIEKLLCQHSLLMGKVAVSLGGGLGTGREGGWMIEQGVEGQREGRYPSGTLSGLLGRVTLQKLQSTSSCSSYVTHLLPLPHYFAFYQCFYKRLSDKLS